jgi:hypothetical protein
MPCSSRGSPDASRQQVRRTGAPRSLGKPYHGRAATISYSVIEYEFDNEYTVTMTAYTPPGWPAGVHPPGSEEFESTAVTWLLDVVPPDYRLHGVLRRYPVALATMARYHTKACVEGARQGYRTARTELAGALPPHAIDTVLAAYRKEGARLAATARAVALVERALRGEVFNRKMQDKHATP